MIVQGVEWLTAAELGQQLGPDVSPELLRDWRRRGLVRAVTVGRVGWYRRDDVLDAERATRHRGRPRAGLTLARPVPDDLLDLTGPPVGGLCPESGGQAPRMLPSTSQRPGAADG